MAHKASLVFSSGFGRHVRQQMSAHVNVVISDTLKRVQTGSVNGNLMSYGLFIYRVVQIWHLLDPSPPPCDTAIVSCYLGSEVFKLGGET